MTKKPRRIVLGNGWADCTNYSVALMKQKSLYFHNCLENIEKINCKYIRLVAEILEEGK